MLQVFGRRCGTAELTTDPGQVCGGQGVKEVVKTQRHILTPQTCQYNTVHRTITDKNNPPSLFAMETECYFRHKL